MPYDDDQVEGTYYCNECNEAVSPSDVVCPFCGADLGEEDLEEENVPIVILKTFTNPVEAEIARDQLAAADIKSFTSSDTAGGMIPAIGRGVRLMVLESDYERALDVLESIDGE